MEIAIQRHLSVIHKEKGWKIRIKIKAKIRIQIQINIRTRIIMDRIIIQTTPETINKEIGTLSDHNGHIATCASALIQASVIQYVQIAIEDIIRMLNAVFLINQTGIRIGISNHQIMEDREQVTYQCHCQTVHHHQIQVRIHHRQQRQKAFSISMA